MANIARANADKRSSKSIKSNKQMCSRIKQKNMLKKLDSDNQFRKITHCLQAGCPLATHLLKYLKMDKIANIIILQKRIVILQAPSIQ